MFSVSSCYSDASGFIYFGLTESPWTCGQPEERQSGGGMGLGWQTMSWNYYLPALAACGPRDRLKRISAKFPHPCLIPPHPHITQNKTGAGEAENQLEDLGKPHM